MSELKQLKYLVLCWNDIHKKAKCLNVRVYDPKHKEVEDDKLYYVKRNLTFHEINVIESNCSFMDSPKDIYKYIVKFLKETNNWGRKPLW